jgi:hypothetical protein
MNMMKKNNCNSRRHFWRVLVATLLLSGSFTSVGAIIVGDDTISRGYEDTYDNTAFGLASKVFTSGTGFAAVDMWSTYLYRAGTVAMLVLRDTGDANNPVVVGFDQQTGSAGLNNFSLSSAIFVQTGDYLGFWNGTGRIEFGSTGALDTIYSCAVGNCPSTLPAVGGTIELPSANILSRDYSINASFTEVSEPGALALICLGLAGLGFARRKTKA